jgi:hypothetical protein
MEHFRERMHRLILGSELHILFPEHVDIDMMPPEEWGRKKAELAAISVDFLRRARTIKR